MFLTCHISSLMKCEMRNVMRFYICFPYFIEYNLDKKCEPGDMDVIFLLDSSGSVKEPGFEKLKNFTSFLVNKMRIGDNSTRVGLFQFTDKPIHEFSLNKYNTKPQLLDAIDRVRFKDRTTNIAAVSNYFRRMVHVGTASLE